MMKVWYCKIGYAHEDAVPPGGDFPMRRAVEKAFEELTLTHPEFIFSGWGATLTESELAVVENRHGF